MKHDITIHVTGPQGSVPSRIAAAIAEMLIEAGVTVECGEGVDREVIGDAIEQLYGVRDLAKVHVATKIAELGTKAG